MSCFTKQVSSLFLGKYLQLFYNQLLKYPSSLFGACTHSSHSLQNISFLAVSHNIIYFSHITNNIFSSFWKPCKSKVMQEYDPVGV